MRSDGVGVRLADARHEAGLSLRELASRAGVATGTIAGITSGKHRPRVDTVERLAAALGVGAAWLAFGDHD